MVNKSILPVFLIVFLSISLIFSIPIFTLSIQLSTYDVIDVSDDSYKYTTSNSSKINELNINSDIGDIRLNYVDARVKHAVVIEVNFMMVGSNLAGKKPSEYFSINWQNTSSPLNFTLELKPESWLDYSSLLVKNLSIIVSIREDLLFDMNIKVKEGDVEIVIPWGVTINDLLVNVTKGDIFYDFEYCTIQGNIIGFIDEGNIDFKTYNAIYTQNSNWNITIETGDIEMTIHQYGDLGANVTGLVEINDGEVSLVYADNRESVGARFRIPYWRNLPFWNNVHVNIPTCLLDDMGVFVCTLLGFNSIVPSGTGDEVEGIIELISDDLEANIVNNYYDVTIKIFEGKLLPMDFSSFPFSI